MRSVGVMGDGRTYDYTLALRGVSTSDFMTADFSRIPYDVLEKVSVRIVNEVKNINRIVYDITSKPPATIEWECKIPSTWLHRAICWGLLYYRDKVVTKKKYTESLVIETLYILFSL